MTRLSLSISTSFGCRRVIIWWRNASPTHWFYNILLTMRWGTNQLFNVFIGQNFLLQQCSGQLKGKMKALITKFKVYVNGYFLFHKLSKGVMSPEPILTLQIIYTLTKMVNGLGFQNSVTRKKKKFYRNTHQFKFIPVIQENTFSVSIGIAHKSSGFLQIKWKI